MIELKRRFINRGVDFTNKQQVTKFFFDLNLQIDDIIAALNAPDAFAAMAPTTGAWKVGDKIYNDAPATGVYLGWVCTVAGTPGTWKPWGLIA